MKQALSSLIVAILKDLGVPDPTVTITIPDDPSHGDYTTSVAMKVWRASQLPQSPQLSRYSSPMELALQVKDRIMNHELRIMRKHGDQNIGKQGQKQSAKQTETHILSAIDRVEVVPPGFINVFLSEASLITSVWRLLKSKERAPAGRKRILVEFAHPNTHKAFHIGHLRNITTGESIVRLLQARGHTVIRVNYQGDVGMHIAKCLYSLFHQPHETHWTHLTHASPSEKVEFLGQAYAAGSKAFEEDAGAKEEIVSINALIYAAAQRFAREQGIDPGTTDYLALVRPDYRNRLDEVYGLWKETRQWSLDYFETIYARVGSRYDRYYFESQCLAGVDIARSAVIKGVLKEDAGAVIFDGKSYGLDTRVFVNSKGLPTYEGKELKLATMESVGHGKLDRMIHVVGPEQASFFAVTFKAEELLGIVRPGVQYHLVYGWVKLKHGKMSSRSGNVVLGEWLLDEAKKEINNILERNISKNKSLASSASLDSSVSLDASQSELIAQKAAVAAVKYAFLKVGTTSEIAFDLGTSVAFDGDSGQYLQYTYARCRSVLRKAGTGVIARSESLSDAAIPFRKEIASLSRTMTLNPEERALARLLIQFPDVVADAADTLSPSVLCTYLFTLAQSFNLFYAKHSILGNQESGISPPARLPSGMAGRAGNQGKKGEVALASLDLKFMNQDSVRFRLLLTDATARVLSRGLHLLGIATMERM